MFFQVVKSHKLSSSIALFITIVFLLQYFKPAFMYNQDGSYKTFGLGYRNKTVVPMWLVVIIIAILSYTGTLYIMNNSHHY